MVFVSIAFGWLIAWGFGRVGRWILSEGPRFQLLYDQTTQWLEGHGVVVAGLWAEHFNVGWLLRSGPGPYRTRQQRDELLDRGVRLRDPRPA